MNKKINNSTILIVLIVIGLILRLLFLFIGAKFYYGENIHTMGDTSSYVNSFINLINEGIYSFNLKNSESAFGRLPGYPFFFGIHYLLFGKYSYIATSISQAILDTSVIYLIFFICRDNFKKDLVGIIASLIYCFYPFTIVWVPQICTEIFANWLCFLILFLLTKNKYKTASIVTIIAFYTRPYMAILMIAVLLKIFINSKNLRTSLKIIVQCSLIFWTLYLPWPVRNYINHDKIVLLKPTGAGYERYREDIRSCRTWIQTWSTDVDNIIHKFSRNDYSSIPEDIMQKSGGHELLASTVQLASNCGGGFYNWKTNKTYPNLQKNCDQQINEQFKQMTKNYKQNNYISYLIDVPLKNIKKTLFKGISLQFSTTKEILMISLFSFRSILLILGIIGILLNTKSIISYSYLIIYPLFLYFFICFIIRQLEMRYILQADCILLIFSSYTIYHISKKIKIAY
ncbi:hypothetical protein [Flammeovirga sp. EKP202]|uniref:hypothetical protein n=1 Tax=Flammeovirga sp. EKP202 TaxID=2770592 RepID=UPI00165EE979|nr:hypothetical protein [Flammeovirga sp. EKP202]MBD0400821.1 hypothetical protein [Flammeovirga sp. EKP202]